MSNGYRDDGTGTEDWGVTSITDQIAAWPGLGCGPDPLADFGRECQHGHLRRKCEMCEVLAERIAIEARLRTAADVLQDARISLSAVAAHCMQPDMAEDARVQLVAIRAVLAQLAKEGLA